MSLFPMRKTCVLLHNFPLFQIHSSTGRYSKPSTLWTIPASLIVVVFWRLLCSHGTVRTLLFMPEYKYSSTHVLICSIIDNLAHTHSFVFGHFVNLQVSFRFKITHDNLNEIYIRGFVYVKIYFLISRNHKNGTRNTYMIISL
jgi:hypothetical protein